MDFSTEEIAGISAGAFVMAACVKMKEDLDALLLKEREFHQAMQILADREIALKKRETKVNERESQMVRLNFEVELLKEQKQALVMGVLRREEEIRNDQAKLDTRERAVTESERAVICQKCEMEEMHAELTESKRQAKRFEASFNKVKDELYLIRHKAKKLHKQWNVERERYQAAFVEQGRVMEQHQEREISNSLSLAKLAMPGECCKPLLL